MSEQLILINMTEFEAAVFKAQETLEDRTNIGTQQEKLIHAALKYFYQPNDCLHEIKIGRYYVDVFSDGMVTEIQTRQFYKFIEKLKHLLSHDVSVKVVHPLIRKRQVIRVDENGETGKPWKTTKQNPLFDAIPELYSLKDIILNPKLSFSFPVLDVTEYKYAEREKRGKRMMNIKQRIPSNLADIVDIKQPEDYHVFLPENLPEKFTTEDYKKAAKVNKSISGVALNLLNRVGVIEKTGKSGKFILYQIKPEIGD